MTSSGPKRTGQPAREGRRYDPVKSARKKADSSRDNWNQTLVRFRFQLDTLYSVRNGQPSGGLVPETALAEIDKQIKEDLKRSVSCFFTAFSLIILLICQPGNSRSGTQRPERENDPGVWRITSKAYSRQSAQLPPLPELTRTRTIQRRPLSQGVSISPFRFDSTRRADLDRILQSPKNLRPSWRS